MALERKDLRARITPAYAGKSICGYANNPIIRDHPRVCGEEFSTVSLGIGS